ncbi:cysteine synthase A [Aerococcaceae bacterium DSM 111020]|nr:cysteine synthase A [Aerococcaceae bacterium DSM 111020]
MTIITNLKELIGNTPLYKLPNADPNSLADIYVKLEMFNIGGSVKDRIALNMIEAAEARGELKPGMTLIEATSGNTGIGIAMVGAWKGYPVIIVMPEDASEERKQLVRAYGGEVVESPASEGTIGARNKSFEMLEENNSYLSLIQHDNFDNPAVHYETTGPEIVKDLGFVPDAFVAGVGTSGTISGVGKYLKEQDSAVKIVLVESENSAVISGKKKPGKNKIAGMGAGFIPKILNRDVYDEILIISNEQAYEKTRELAKEGLLLGASSGANIQAALQVANDLGPGKTVVTTAADNGERYLSTDLYQ